jgi:adenine-specific DNA-methyltransferase
MSIEKLTAADPITRSADLVAENIARLRVLFPEAFVEGKIDFDVLKQLLGGYVDESEEKFGLVWHGKHRSRELALTPSTGTLRPCPEESVDWESTRNLLIEGDNLEVLKLLQRSYSGRVKLVYIDPPYNTGRDFVYPDDFQDSIRNYLKLTHQIDGNGRKLSSNTDASGRFHTDWLNMMYPRLMLARNLLRDDGVIFISIDDHEVAQLRLLCNEVYGEENFVGILVWQHSLQPKGYPGKFSVHHNFVLCYQKSEVFELSNLDRTAEHNRNYSNPDNDPNGAWRPGDVRNALFRPNLIYNVTTPSGKTIEPPPNGWRWSRETLQAKIASGEIVFSSDESRIIRKIYLSQIEGRTPETILFGKDVGTTRDAVSEIKALFDGQVPFDTPKPTALIEHLIALSGAKGDDLVLDFFAGSGTTGEAVWRFNAGKTQALRVIMVQLPATLDPEDQQQRLAAEICQFLGRPKTLTELTKERLRRAGATLHNANPGTTDDFGFRVFKLASSNILSWEPNPSDLEMTLSVSVEHLKEGRTEADILFELLLKLGYDLSGPVEHSSINGFLVYSFGAGSVFVCLAPLITRSDVEGLSLGIVGWHSIQQPSSEPTVYFLDSAFTDDVVKSNLAGILYQNGLQNVRSL